MNEPTELINQFHEIKVKQIIEDSFNFELTPGDKIATILIKKDKTKSVQLLGLECTEKKIVGRIIIQGIIKDE